MNRTFKAYAIFTGGMIGVGIFGIPYSLMRSGAWPTLVTGFVVLMLAFMINLFAIELVLMAKGKRQLPGYIAIYLGSKGKVLETVASVGGNVGALLAYLIAGGSFLALCLSPFFHISPITATLIYFICGASLVFWGMQGHPFVHLIIYLMFVVVLAFLIWFSSGVFLWQNVPLFGNGLITPFLLPYGVLLFAFGGAGLIPELADITRSNRKTMRRVIVAGFALALVSYVVFSVLITGINGAGTTEDAIGGLYSLGPTGQKLAIIGGLFGVLTTFSSFLSVGRTLKRTLIFDFHFSHVGAWLIAMGTPLLLYFAGVQGFIRVLGITGAVFLGLEGILIIASYWVAHSAKSKRITSIAGRPTLFALGFFLTFGVLVEILRVLKII